MTTWSPEVIQASLWSRQLASSFASSVCTTFIVPDSFVTPEDAPDLQFWEQVWVSHTSSVKLSFQLCFRNTCKPRSIHEIACWLAADLLRWKIWEELGLEATSAGPAIPAEFIPASWDVAIHLRRRQHQGSKRAGEPCQQTDDCTTPVNVPLLTLRAIRVTLTFEDGQSPQKRPRLSPQRSCDAAQELLDLDEPPHVSAVVGTPVATRSELFNSSSNATIVPIQQTYSPEEMEVSQPEEFLLLEEDTFSPNRRRGIQGLVKEDLLNPGDRYEAIVSLIDAAFRRAIVSKPHYMSTHVQYDLRHGSANLVDIAPSMFCPGYMQACALRASNMSSIAASLNGISKQMAPSQQHESARSLSPINSRPLRKASEAEIQGKLWLLMRKKVLKRGQARRLSTFRPSGSSGTGHLEEPYLLLEDDNSDGDPDDDSICDLLDSTGTCEDEHGLCDLLDDDYEDIQPYSQDSGIGLDKLLEGDHISDLPEDEAVGFDGEELHQEILLENLLDF